MSQHSHALDLEAWKDAGSPTTVDHACPTCGRTWTTKTEHSTCSSPDGYGYRDDPHTYVCQGKACDCARRQREAEREAEREAARVRQEASDALQRQREAEEAEEVARYPEPNPEMTIYSLGLDEHLPWRDYVARAQREADIMAGPDLEGVPTTVVCRLVAGKLKLYWVKKGGNGR